MRFSTFSASLLVSTAAAWRLPDFDWSNEDLQGFQGWQWLRPSHVSSVAASAAPTKTAAASVSYVASASQVATTVVATVTPTSAVADAVSTKPASTGTSSSGSLTSDQQNALDAHNAARAEVGTAALSWDASLAADALAYAKTLASSGTFQHSGVSGQGENLYMQSGSNTPLTNAVKGFLEEKSAYNGQAISSTNFQSFGHYTQCVWKTTSKVGMASAVGSNGNTYVVARYTAPGNFIGQTAY